jgi:hypothetical protein
MQINIYDVRHAVNPTHIRTAFMDGIRNRALIQTVYTGALGIRHGAGGRSKVIDFQYPLIGFFRENNGNMTPGIIPIDREGGEEFLGAAAMAALSIITIKDTASLLNVFSLDADLFRVDLAPKNLQVLVVVLTGTVETNDAEVTSLNYNVTVLNGRSDRTGGFTAPILSNSADWNGMYGAIGASPVLRGRPSETLP